MRCTHRMRNFLIMAFLLFSFFSFTNLYANDCLLKGKWKSNLEKTILEINKNSDLTPKQKNYPYHEIFGKLEVEFTCNEMIMNNAGETSRIEYRVVKKDGPFITIRYFEAALDDEVEETLELIGDCYYSPPIRVLGFPFKEAMCKMK